MTMRLLSGFALVAFTLASGAGAQTIPRWNATRDLLIDGNAADLSKVGFVRVDRAGTIYVGQPQDLHVRAFAADGAPMRTMGRKGGGPGEFQWMGDGGFSGDTLWVSGSQGLNRYAPDGKLPPPIRPTAPKVDGSTGASQVITVTPTGDLIWSVVTRVRDSLHWSLIRTDARSAIRNVLGGDALTHGVLRRDALGEADTWAMGMDLNEPAVGIAADGSAFAVVDAPVYGSEVGRARVALVRPSGDTVYVRSVPITLQRIPVGEVDSLVAWLKRNQRSRDNRQVLAAMRPEFYPPVTGVCVGRDGSVLITFHAGATERELLLIDPSGTPVAALRLPKAVEVRQIEGDRVWGILRDANGVESIVRYRVGP
jgi:hypothetical protein